MFQVENSLGRNKFFYIDPVPRTINYAYYRCSRLGSASVYESKLWEPQTLEIMNGVHAHVQTLNLEKVGIWVGITDEGSEGEWHYTSTGESFPFEVKIHESV